jgi:hypothetical protein
MSTEGRLRWEAALGVENTEAPLLGVENAEGPPLGVENAEDPREFLADAVEQGVDASVLALSSLSQVRVTPSNAGKTLALPPLKSLLWRPIATSIVKI